MTQTVHNLFTKSCLLLLTGMSSFFTQAQSSAPELVFRNAVLTSGTVNTEGAVYRFSNVTPGVDAEVTLKKFSRPDIVMQDVDLPGLGHDKSFQPQFGLPGVVSPYQSWYVDFEMSFYKAGTTTKQALSQAAFTALDVDGDGLSIGEFIRFENANSVAYSPVTALVDSANAEPVFSGNTTTNQFICPLCAFSENLKRCSDCRGLGYVQTNANGSGITTVQCTTCGGSGSIYKACGHAFTGVKQAAGPVLNYNNIDTAATQVMATYTFLNKDHIAFRYGAHSGAVASNGAGVRLNSLWGKSFSLAPWTTLPVKFTSFTVLLKAADAVLNWEAAQDESLSHFVIQRSTDGTAYTNIAVVFAGASTAYQFKDKNLNPASGVVYYRVVAVDQTKETSVSAVKMVRLTQTEAASLVLATFPNPVAADLRISLPTAWQGKAVTFEVFNANGILAKAVHAVNAAQTETVGLTNLTKGMYVVKATCGGETAAQRIVKN